MAQSITLKDGRNLSYQIAGAEDGFPLFFMSGTPGSYVPPLGLPEACEKKGLKVISLSRAGYGESTRRKDRNVVNAVEDINALKEHLGFKECVGMGWSGGGPPVMACAARLPGCLAVTSVAGVAPHDAEGLDWIAGQGEENVQEYKASLQGEPALQEFCKNIRSELLATTAEGVTTAMASLLPDVDKKALEDHPKMGQNIVDSCQEGLKHNADGHVDDSMSFIKPWGFDLNEIKVPVFLWQGDKDLMVPLAHGEWLGKNLPQDQVVVHRVEGEGHISIFFGRIDDMLDELLAVKNKK